ncbi:MAG: hypothetical protein ACE5K0_06600 [Candidatus Methanofastidiosia archaeon]
MRRIIGHILLTLLFISILMNFAISEEKKGILEVIVYYSDNYTPINKANVAIYDQEWKRLRQYGGSTDELGSFETILPIGTYNIEIYFHSDDPVATKEDVDVIEGHKIIRIKTNVRKPWERETYLSFIAIIVAIISLGMQFKKK